MAEYIDKWAVVNRLTALENEFQQYKPFHGFEHAMYRKICEAEIAIGETPAADVAPRAAYEQVAWERDIAMKQLEECGIPFGGKADVAPVVHGRWIRCRNETKCSNCKFIYYSNRDDFNYCPNCGAKMDGGAG